MNMNMKVIIGIIAVVVVILGVAVFTMGNASPATTSSGSDQILLVTSPNPPTTGTSTFTINVKDTQGKPVDNAKVSFNVNMTSMNMGSQQGTATSQGSGKYAAKGSFSMRGPWRVSATVVMPDGKQMNQDFDLNVE